VKFKNITHNNKSTRFQLFHCKRVIFSLLEPESVYFVLHLYALIYKAFSRITKGEAMYETHLNKEFNLITFHELKLISVCII
jgi:hypothetical protein